jgi:hypothetical protein
MNLVLHATRLALVSLVATAGLAHASARLASVVPVDGGCICGPSGRSVQTWDLEPGKKYLVTISGVTDCGLGGTAATIDVRVKNSAGWKADLVATLVEPGRYAFNCTAPQALANTGPILYCTTSSGGPGEPVLRSDGGKHFAHLRVIPFRRWCAGRGAISEGGCHVVASVPSTWGELKTIYR